MENTTATARHVPANHGWQWIKTGFNLFKSNPGMWMVLFIVYFIIAFIMSLVPFIGQVALNLIAPVFLAGFMLGCRALDNKQDLEINHLFAAFKSYATPLITVGGTYLVGIIVVVGVVLLLGVDQDALKHAGDAENLPDEEKLALMTSLLKPLMVILLILIPMMMAYWFAPALVVFKNLSAIDAMKLSFKACFMNLTPFLVYVLAAMLLLMLASIPFGLGLLVMVPVMMASIYASYQDILESSPNADPNTVIQKM
jgi:uncharacterized membrane protein